MLTRNRMVGMSLLVLAVAGGYATAPLPASADDGRLVVDPAVYRTNDSKAHVQTVQYFGPRRYGYYRPYYRPYVYGGYYPPPPPPPPPGYYGYPAYGYGYPPYGYGYPPYGYGYYGPRVGIGIW